MSTANHRGREIVFVDSFAHAAAIGGDLVEIPARRIAGVRLRAHQKIESCLSRIDSSANRQ